MRIGLVRRGYSPAGGAETYLRGFAEAASRAGHETVLFASPEWSDWALGEKITVAGSSPRAFSDRLAAMQPREKCDTLFSLERVSSCDVYRAGDGVHAAWLQRRSQFASPLRRMGFAVNPKHHALLQLEKQAMLGARRIVANSKMVAQEIGENYGSTVAAKVNVIYNGIDPQKWAVAPAPRGLLRKKFGLSERDRVVAYIGSGWERKGLRFAIEAAKKANAILLVSGRGEPAKFLAPHVRFLGPTSKVAEVLHAADAFISPTIYDPFSNATLEALAAGLPVITTQANGVAEILDPQTDGSAVEKCNDIPALAAALDQWIFHPAHELRQQHAARFTLERNLAETLHIITS